MDSFIPTLSSTARGEEQRLHFLRISIALYLETFGRLPEKLEDLCFDHHKHPKWDGAFIDWKGKETFRDLFGMPYLFEVRGATFMVTSPGLESWKKNEKPG
jgi:hypothetical protein